MPGEGADGARPWTLSADDVILLDLLRTRGAMTSVQLDMFGLRRTALELQNQLHELAANGLLESRLDLYLITDAGLAALTDRA
jgi:hypothetical protein